MLRVGDRVRIIGTEADGCTGIIADYMDGEMLPFMVDFEDNEGQGGTDFFGKNELEPLEITLNSFVAKHGVTFPECDTAAVLKLANHKKTDIIILVDVTHDDFKDDLKALAEGLSLRD